MRIYIAYNSDATDQEIFAAECGIISKLSEELKYRVEDLGGDIKVIQQLEVMEFEYCNEANNVFEFWDDLIDGHPENMTYTELKQNILDLLPSVTPKMSYDQEREFVEAI